MKKLILAFASIIALVFVIGSVGALEHDNINMLQCVIQCAIGVGIEWFALSKIEE
jgi:hypothetical protein